MSSEGSVTHWLRLLQAGERDAAGPLWERYYRLLVARARAALGSAPRRVADEEDVALSAFDSFCRGAEHGRFPRLDDREDLWRLLLVITARKAGHLRVRENAAKRGGGRVQAETDLAAGREDDLLVLSQVVAEEPTPEFSAQLAEECRRLLDQLESDDLRSIAVWQMEGYTVDEMAERLGRSPRTVARKLTVIRDRWSQELS